MSLPGLHVATPAQEVAVTAINDLKERSEWRFEVSHDNNIQVKASSPQ